MWYVVFFLLQNKFSSIDSFSQATLLSNGLVDKAGLLAYSRNDINFRNCFCFR